MLLDEDFFIQSSSWCESQVACCSSAGHSSHEQHSTHADVCKRCRAADVERQRGETEAGAGAGIVWMGGVDFCSDVHVQKHTRT
jgi:hypothetical protein